MVSLFRAKVKFPSVARVVKKLIDFCLHSIQMPHSISLNKTKDTLNQR